MKSIVIKYVYGSSNKLYKGEMKMDKLMVMTLAELKAVAKEVGLKGVSRCNKKELAAALFEHGYRVDDPSEQVTIEDTLTEGTELTDKERQVMIALTHDDFYEDGEESVLWLEVAVESVSAETGLSNKAVGGVLSSLEKKGYVYMESGKDGAIGFERLGKEFIRSLEEAKPKKAILKTFTGMVIGKAKEDGTPFTYELVEHDGLYRLTKLDGKVLEFDSVTLKQVNAKNPKFANKIELV